MSAGINFTRIWFDDDVVQLKIGSSDGKSVFCNEVYLGHKDLDDLIAGLSTFRNHVHGGLFDIVLGSFGPEYAGGAFHARLHFQSPSKIIVTVRVQSDFQEFGIKTVASEATLYLRTEPILLDNFISELRALKSGKRDDANVQAV